MAYSKFKNAVPQLDRGVVRGKMIRCVRAKSLRNCVCILFLCRRGHAKPTINAASIKFGETMEWVVEISHAPFI